MCQVVLAIVASLFVAHIVGANDTALDSQFNYEYNVIQKLIQLENDNRNLRNMVLNLTEGQEGKCIKNILKSYFKN